MLRKLLVALVSLMLLPSAQASVSTSCSTTGPQQTAVILVNLPNYNLPANVTVDYINGVLFGNAFTTNPANQNTPDISLNDFLIKNSNNQINIDTANSIVVGPYTLPHNYNGDTSSSTCDVGALENDAMAAAVAANPGLNLAQYSRLMFITPTNGSCSGLRTGSCATKTAPDSTQFQASDAIFFAEYLTNRLQSVSLTARAMGYNLGLNNGRVRSCAFNTTQGSYYDALGPLGNSCVFYNFSDPFTVMGTGKLGFYSAKHAAENLNWLQSSDSTQSNYYVEIPNASQNNSTTDVTYNYSLQYYEGDPTVPANTPKALKIQRGTGAWLWVEARTSAPIIVNSIDTNIYDNSLDSQVSNGVLIHYQDSNTQSTGTDLLDFTPFTSSWNDAVLAVDQTWNDPYSNLTLKVTRNAQNSNLLDVTAKYLPAAPTCTPTAPIVTISPSSATINPGSSAIFTVTTTNPAANCLNKKYTNYLGSSPGWSLYFDNNPTLFSFYNYLTAGQSKTSTLTVVAPANAAPGQYVVLAKAYDDSKINNILYSDPTPGRAVAYVPATLTVTVTGAGTVTSSPAGLTCSNGVCTGKFKTNTYVLLTGIPGGTNNTITWTGTNPVTNLPLTLVNPTYNVSITKDTNMSVSFSYVKPKGRK